jgi:RNA polymerase sigma-70 factor (ECF subfamily)
LRTWESIPPKKPEVLKSFVGKIARNIALDRYDYNTAAKRCEGTEMIIGEMADCIPDTSASLSDEYVLRQVINKFLASLSKRTRIIFMRRYFYMCSVKSIAESLSLSESYVKVTLLRARNKFKELLEKEGISI